MRDQRFGPAGAERGCGGGEGEVGDGDGVGLAWVVAVEGDLGDGRAVVEGLVGGGGSLGVRDGVEGVFGGRAECDGRGV